MTFLFRFATLFSTAALCGCVPAALRGDYPDISPRAAAVAPPADGAAMRVRWGGTILSAHNEPERTCFEVLGLPLDGSARPAASERDEGRFVACQSGYSDPGLFVPGRDITVVGVVTGIEARRVGEYQYRYPRLAADTVHLWPQHEWEPVFYAYELFPYVHTYAVSYSYHYYVPVDADALPDSEWPPQPEEPAPVAEGLTQIMTVR